MTGGGEEVGEKDGRGKGRSKAGKPRGQVVVKRVNMRGVEKGIKWLGKQRKGKWVMGGEGIS